MPEDPYGGRQTFLEADGLLILVVFFLVLAFLFEVPEEVAEDSVEF
jgi:hypothetical protein